MPKFIHDFLRSVFKDTTPSCTYISLSPHHHHYLTPANTSSLNPKSFSAKPLLPAVADLTAPLPWSLLRPPLATSLRPVMSTLLLLQLWQGVAVFLRQTTGTWRWICDQLAQPTNSFHSRACLLYLLLSLSLPLNSHFWCSHHQSRPCLIPPHCGPFSSVIYQSQVTPPHSLAVSSGSLSVSPTPPL